MHFPLDDVPPGRQAGKGGGDERGHKLEEEEKAIRKAMGRGCNWGRSKWHGGRWQNERGKRDWVSDRGNQKIRPS